MRTKHIAFFVLIAAVVLMFTGCDALFQNTFQQLNLAQPSATALAEQAASSDPQVAQTALNTILTQNIEKAGATELLTSMNLGTIVDATSSGSTPSAGTIIDAVIPTDLQNDPTKLAEVINNLASLQADVQALADNIASNGATSSADAGSALQTAIIVTLVNDVTRNPAYSSNGEAIATYIQEINDPANDPATINPDDYFTVDLSAVGSDSSITSLLAANGISDTLEDYLASLAG